MKIARYVLPLMVSATMMTGAAFAQTDMGTSDSSTAGSMTTPNTQIEVQNQAPAAQAPAQQAPNIDIKMPDAPDVNITTPANTGTNTSSTVRESSERVIIDDTNDAETSNGNVMMMVLFGVLAIFLIGMVIMASTRRSPVQ